MKKISLCFMLLILSSCNSGTPTSPELTNLKQGEIKQEKALYENYSAILLNAERKAFSAIDSILIVNGLIEIANQTTQ